MQRNSPGTARDGGPVVLRLVRATPCYIQSNEAMKLIAQANEQQVEQSVRCACAVNSRLLAVL